MRPSGRLPRLAVLVPAAALAALVVVSACSSSPGRSSPPEVPGGNPSQGVTALEQFGCGSCHTIPGIRGADGEVGPPLLDWRRRGFIAGELPNSGPNLRYRPKPALSWAVG